jgi:predicted DNA-binding transcriptional regulator AlpA
MINSAEATPVGKLLSKRQVADSFSVCTRTIMNKTKDDPAFPRPVKMGERVYFLERDVEEYKRRIVLQHMSGGASV